MLFFRQRMKIDTVDFGTSFGSMFFVSTNSMFGMQMGTCVGIHRIPSVNLPLVFIMSLVT